MVRRVRWNEGLVVYARSILDLPTTFPSGAVNWQRRPWAIGQKSLFVILAACMRRASFIAISMKSLYLLRLALSGSPVVGLPWRTRSGCDRGGEPSLLLARGCGRPASQAGSMADHRPGDR